MPVCPACRGELASAKEALRCSACQLDYPMIDGIAHLLSSEARPVKTGAVSGRPGGGKQRKGSGGKRGR